MFIPWWIVDNLSLLLLFLGVVAICFGAAWWSTRKNKLLIGLGVAVLLMVLAWLLSQVIVTDRMQLVLNVESMRDLINDGKLDKALEHFEDEVTIDAMGGLRTIKRADIQAVAKSNMGMYKVNRVVANKIEVEELARPKAKVTFFLGPEDSAERGLCTMRFELSPDGKWRVKMVTVESMVGGHKMPLISLPF